MNEIYQIKSFHNFITTFKLIKYRNSFNISIIIKFFENKCFQKLSFENITDIITSQKYFQNENRIGINLVVYGTVETIFAS